MNTITTIPIPATAVEPVDIDAHTQWQLQFWLRGKLLTTVNPLRADMSILDEQVDPTGKDAQALTREVGDLALRMLDVIFADCDQWKDLKADAKVTLSQHERLAVLSAFLRAYAQRAGMPESVMAQWSLVKRPLPPAPQRPAAASSPTVPAATTALPTGIQPVSALAATPGVLGRIPIRSTPNPNLAGLREIAPESVLRPASAPSSPVEATGT